MEVLERFALGDLEAFEILFREFQGEVYRCTYRIVRDSATAEDLTLEAFWRIYRARARFDPSRSFKSWARRIATNLALDHLKTSACTPNFLKISLNPGPRIRHSPAMFVSASSKPSLGCRLSFGLRRFWRS